MSQRHARRGACGRGGTGHRPVGSDERKSRQDLQMQTGIRRTRSGRQVGRAHAAPRAGRPSAARGVSQLQALVALSPAVARLGAILQGMFTSPASNASHFGNHQSKFADAGADR